MSGGFFRGTSADQDTRFSNKHAKLLKSQKFAPELDQTVDTKKVNLDVMRPWIATRVIELLGFEDEVLINFIYQLLEKKVVDGKEVQIQLTGFMEKNTGKFMKELWSLLLSAESNVSGVPQQFLDAKAEETREKKAETDKIAEEIQKRREKEEREFDEEKHNKMDAEADNSRNSDPVCDSVSEHSLPRTTEDKRDRERRHSSRTKSRRSKSPHSNEYSAVSRRSTSSSDRSSGKPYSNSRSYSRVRLRARSVSISSGSRKLSASPARQRRSPLRCPDSPGRQNMPVYRRSISPRRIRSSPKLRSPLRRRSPQKRRRSTSRSRHKFSPIRRRSPPAWRRSPSPRRRRSPSPRRRRSPSPRRRRSPSPLRRRSPFPLRRRSPNPLRRRSPSPPRRRSPSPLHQRSPVHRKLPSLLHNRSPTWRRSLSPAGRRSPTPLVRSPPKYRRTSPLPSPRSRAADSQVSLRQKNRSRSPSYRTRRSSSREGDSCVNGIQSRRHRDEHVSQRAHVKKAPDHHSLRKNTAEQPDLKEKVSDSVSHKLSASLWSTQHDSRVQSDTVPDVTHQKSLDQSVYQQNTHPMKSRSPSSSGSPVKQNKRRFSRHDSPETNEGKTSHARSQSHAREDARRRTDYLHERSKHLPADVAKMFIANEKSPQIRSPDSEIDVPDKNHRVLPSLEGKEYGPGRVNEESHPVDDVYDGHQLKKRDARDAAYFHKKQSNDQAEKNSTRDDHSRSENDEHRESHIEEYAKKSKHKVDKRDQLKYIDTDSEEGDIYRYHSKEKGKHKKSENDKRDLEGVAEYDTEADDRKDAKRRRKNEKRQHKEERRRRREERHRRRLQRRADKLELKSVDTVTPPSDLEKNHVDADRTYDDISMQGVSHPSDTKETASEQKKLEIDLRKKALESLRAKKAIND